MGLLLQASLSPGKKARHTCKPRLKLQNQPTMWIDHRPVSDDNCQHALFVPATGARESKAEALKHEGRSMWSASQGNVAGDHMQDRPQQRLLRLSMCSPLSAVLQKHHLRDMRDDLPREITNSLKLRQVLRERSTILSRLQIAYGN